MYSVNEEAALLQVLALPVVCMHHLACLGVWLGQSLAMFWSININQQAFIMLKGKHFIFTDSESDIFKFIEKLD